MFVSIDKLKNDLIELEDSVRSGLRYAGSGWEKQGGARSERARWLAKIKRINADGVADLANLAAELEKVVHSVQDMNFQVALQHEFTALGIIPIIEELESTDADDLKEQIEAYQDNFLNVSELAKDAEAHVRDEGVIKKLWADVKALQDKAEEAEHGVDGQRDDRAEGAHRDGRREQQRVGVDDNVGLVDSQLLGVPLREVCVGPLEHHLVPLRAVPWTLAYDSHENRAAALS